MARMSLIMARLKRDPIADLPIAAHVDQVLQAQGIAWRDRLLPPLVTLRLFVTQIPHGNCAICALRQLCGLGFAVSSYVEARGRLPLQLLESLLQWVNEQARETLADVPHFARRIFIADASTYSMPDTPELSAHFDLAPRTEVGVGYPMGKLLGLIDLATGMFVSLLAVPLFAHEMRDAAELHPCSAPAISLRQAVPFAPTCTWRCCRSEACLPACICINCVKIRRPAVSAGTSPGSAATGWTHSAAALSMPCAGRRPA